MDMLVTAPATRIGVDGEGSLPLRRDDALALLHLFDGHDAERRALSAQLVAVPDGQRLYVTPRIGF